MCQVFRSLAIGKEYYVTINTIECDNKYYSSLNKLHYVGKFLYTKSNGLHDNHNAVFDDHGKQKIIPLDFDQQPFFIEKDCVKQTESKPTKIILQPTKQEKICEVFRIPEQGKEYYTTIDTFKENGKYYSTINNLRYVGKYMYHASDGGYGDSANHCAVFNNNGKEEFVSYDYEGKTCFVEKLF